MPIESPVGRSSATAHRVQETVELYSDDEDADKVASANRADTSDTRNLSPAMRMPAPVPLAAMISSDEEEDDDEPPPPIARKTEKKTMIGRRMSPDDAGDDDEEEEEEMAAARTARDEEYASGNWDSRESDDESGPYGRERSDSSRCRAIAMSPSATFRSRTRRSTTSMRALRRRSSRSR